LFIRVKERNDASATTKGEGKAKVVEVSHEIERNDSVGEEKVIVSDKQEDVKGIMIDLQLREYKMDIWKAKCNWIVITTNGQLRSNGALVMGAGIALQAQTRVPNCASQLGKCVRDGGSKIYVLPRHSHQQSLVSFPTKTKWRPKSDLKLIETSCQQLIQAWESERRQCPFVKGPIVALTQVGCLNGGLSYSRQVRPILERFFGTPERRPFFFVCIS